MQGKNSNSIASLRFYTECFERENEKRTRWFLKNQKKLEKMAELPQKYRDIRTAEVMKLPSQMCSEGLSLDHIHYAGNRRKKPLRDGILQIRKKEDVAIEPTMKKVKPEHKTLLYEPLPNGGRVPYLEKRNRIKPEEKYNFCETGNGRYGWRLGDSLQANQRSRIGRYYVFEHDLVSLSAPHRPDPDHYKDPGMDLYSKCS